MLTRFLKKWCGLSRSADTARIFLSKASGGLDIPSITTCFKKAQVSRYSQLKASTDPTCRFLAERKHARDTGIHKKLKPTIKMSWPPCRNAPMQQEADLQVKLARESPARMRGRSLTVPAPQSRKATHSLSLRKVMNNIVTLRALLRLCHGGSRRLPTT